MPMKTELPKNFQEYRQLNFTRESMSYLARNIFMAMMLILFFVVLSFYTQQVRTDFKPVEFLSFKGWEIALFLAVALVTMFVHEGLHWAAAKLFTKATPLFILSGIAPHTVIHHAYFSKLPYILLKLVPTVVPTAVYLVLAPLLPFNWIEMAIYFFAGNLAYATTDYLAMAEAIRAPKTVLIEDAGEQVYFYADKAFVDKMKAKNRAGVR